MLSYRQTYFRESFTVLPSYGLTLGTVEETRGKNFNFASKLKVICFLSKASHAILSDVLKF